MKKITILLLASTLAFTACSLGSANAATPKAALVKALAVTQKAVLTSTLVRVEGNDAGTKRGSTTTIVDQNNYSILSGKRLEVHIGSMLYDGINNPEFSKEELAAVFAKYPAAKYKTANVGTSPIGYDAVTYLTGYIIDMAKSGLVTQVKKGKSTTYRFTAAKIAASEWWSEYLGFDNQPISGSIQIDSKGRIVYAYAVTADKTTSLKISYSYAKQRVVAPKASECITQEEFFALVPSL